MNTINITVGACLKSYGIPIGRRGENEVTAVQFDISTLVDSFGEGAVELLVQRPTDTAPYPVTVITDGNIVTWTVTNTDTVFVGRGKCELFYYVGEQLAKTVVWPIDISHDIGGEAVDPPDPYETWLETLTGLAAETQENAQNAAQSANDAETAQTAAETAQGKAEDAQEAAETAQANAETSETNAAVSATAAATSEANASTSETNAAAQATNAAGSASAASGSASSASASATDAATSATNAATSASNAAKSAEDAEASAEAAAQSAEDALETLYSFLPTDTASGSIASFPDGANNVPVQSLTVSIEPEQAGSGDPAPDNVRPISGWTQANVTRTGKNLSNTEQLPPAAYWGGSYAALVDLVNSLPVGTYTLSHKATTLALPDNGVVQHGPFYVTAMVNGSQVPVSSYRTTTDNLPSVGKVYEDSTTFTITETNKGKCNHVYAYCDSSVHTGAGRGNYKIYDIQLELGSTATSYEPYTGDTITIDLDGTRYGGTLDVLTGVMTVDRAMAALDGTEGYGWNNSGVAYTAVKNGKITDAITQYQVFTQCDKLEGTSWVGRNSCDNCCGMYYGGSYVFIKSSSNFSDASGAKAWVAQNPLQIVYYLATPFTVQLDPVTISTLKGTNNIWADAGDVSVTYRADIGLYIDKKIEEA